MLSFILRLLSAFVLLLTALMPWTALPAPRCEAEFSGTFIQSWMSAYWDEETWSREVDYMSEAGIDTLILQDIATLHDGGEWELYYPSGLEVFASTEACGDVIAAALASCERAGIDVYIGLTMFDGWWLAGGLAGDYGLICDTAADMAREIYGRYHADYPDTLAGWYFTPELSNLPTAMFTVPSIAKGLNTILDTVTSLDASMPMLMSPYFTEYISVPTVTGVLPMWTAFFECVHLRDGDIFAPQDAVGAGWTSAGNLEKVWKMYAAAVDACRADIRLWANCENFTAAYAPGFGRGIVTPPATVNTEMLPATLDRFVGQMETASHYAEKIITFSYNHYYSPARGNAAYHEAYLDYLVNGHSLESEPPSCPGNISCGPGADGTITVRWDTSSDNIGVAHYILCSDGEPVAVVRHDGRAVYTTDIPVGGRAAVIAVDAAGNRSAN